MTLIETIRAIRKKNKWKSQTFEEDLAKIFSMNR